MKATCGLLAAWMVIASAVPAESLPTPGLTDARIQTATYRDDEVYALTGTVGYQIDMVFDRDEHFVGLGAGDMDGLSFEAQGNHLFLKPKAAPVATNLTILTDRRQYVVAYTVNAMQRPGSGDVGVTTRAPLYAVRFNYPVEHLAATERAAEAAARAVAVTEALATARPVLNSDYSFCGARSLRPTRVTDDGVHTRFTFPTRVEVPAIFVRNDDGSEAIVNFSVTADAIVVHRIARQFILRRGKLVGCVVNRHFDGSGAALETSTVSDTVRRVTPTIP
jgi:type IV secretion system protein VirB9